MKYLFTFHKLICTGWCTSGTLLYCWYR